MKITPPNFILMTQKFKVDPDEYKLLSINADMPSGLKQIKVLQSDSDTSILFKRLKITQHLFRRSQITCI